MKINDSKLEQAEYIEKNGCSDLNCLQCRFITGVCRIYKPETSPDIKNKVNLYLRKYKLLKINKL